MSSVLYKVLCGTFVAILSVSIAYAQPACDGNRQSFACSCTDSSDGLTVSCEYRNFKDIPDGIPDDVITLNLVHNKIEELKTDKLERFGKLKRLDLKHNGLRTIEERAFYGLDDLQELDLSHNNLTLVPCDEFQWVRSLTTLHMTENPVSSLPGQCFLPLRQVEDIDLSSTSISSVGEIPFDKMENLKVLDLSGNSLETIPEGFCPETGQTVNLHWNPWLCDCTMKPLRACEGLSKQIKCAMPYEIRGWSIGDLENADQWMACGLPKAVSSKVQYIREGDAVHLACDDKVDPYDNVKWWLVEDETWEARGELTLYVHNDHAGTYVCASNDDKTKWAFQEVRVLPPETSPTPPVIPPFGTTSSKTTLSKGGETSSPSPAGSTKGMSSTGKGASSTQNPGSSTKDPQTTKGYVGSSGSTSAVPLPPAGNVQSTANSVSSPGNNGGNGGTGNTPGAATPSSQESGKQSTAASKTSPIGGVPSLVGTEKSDDDNSVVPLVPATPRSQPTQMTTASSGGVGDDTNAIGQPGKDGKTTPSRRRGDSVYPIDSDPAEDQTTQISVLSSDDGLGAGLLPGRPGDVVIGRPVDDQGNRADDRESKAESTQRRDMTGIWVIIAVACIVTLYILIGLICLCVYRCSRKSRRKKKAPIVMIEESPEKAPENIELVDILSTDQASPGNADGQSPGHSLPKDNAELSDNVANHTKWTEAGVPLALPDQNEETGQILDRHSRGPSDRSSGPPRSDQLLDQEAPVTDESSPSEDDQIPEGVVDPDKWMNPHQLHAIPDQKTDKPDRDSITDDRDSKRESETFWKNPFESLDNKKYGQESPPSNDDAASIPPSPEHDSDDRDSPDLDLSDFPLFRSPKGSRDTASSPQERDGSPLPALFENPWIPFSELESATPDRSPSPASSPENDRATPQSESPEPLPDIKVPPAKIEDVDMDKLPQAPWQKPVDEANKSSSPSSIKNSKWPPSPPKDPLKDIVVPPDKTKDIPKDELQQRPPQEPADEVSKGKPPPSKSSERPPSPPSIRNSPPIPPDNGEKANKPQTPPLTKPQNEPQTAKPKENEDKIIYPRRVPTDESKSRPLSIPDMLPDSLKKLSIFTPEPPPPIVVQPPVKPSRKKPRSNPKDFVIPPFDN